MPIEVHSPNQPEKSRLRVKWLLGITFGWFVDAPVPTIHVLFMMKLLISTVTFACCSLSLIACSGGTSNETAQTPQPQATTSVSPSPAASSSPVSSPAAAKKPAATQPAIADDVADVEPEVGVIKQLQQGDQMCYVTFTDAAGAERQVGATFELCEQQDRYLNQRVRLIYGVRNVSDCQSNEPCGKTRRANVVIKMEPVDQAGRVTPTDSVTLKNGSWTITIGNRNDWSGVNGTGNLTYRGCDANQQCLDLTGGTMTCREGVCVSSWKNGNYSYTLESPITEESGGSNRTASTLTVRQNGTVLTRITDLR